MIAKRENRLIKENKNLLVMELSVTTDEGMKEAIKFGIRTVPALIINNKYVIRGIPKLEELKSILEVRG